MAIFAHDDLTLLQYRNLTTVPDLSPFLKLNETSENQSTKELQRLPVLSVDINDPFKAEDEDGALQAHIPLLNGSHVARTSSKYRISQRLERKPTCTTISPTSARDLRPQLKHTGKKDPFNGPKLTLEPRQLAQKQSPVTTFGSRKYMSSNVFRKTALEAKRKYPSASTTLLSEASEASPRSLSTPYTSDKSTTRSTLKLKPSHNRSKSSSHTAAAKLNSIYSLRPTATHRPFLLSAASVTETHKKSKEIKDETKNLLPLTLKMLGGSSATSATVIPQLATLKVSSSFSSLYFTSFHLFPFFCKYCR